MCGRTLGPFDRAAWKWEGWRRKGFAGCEACLGQEEGELLVYEVWEAPELWASED